jgi:hypothetical protein
MAVAADDRLDQSRSHSSASIPTEQLSDGVEWAARLGYAAKGVVYAVVGGIAVQQAIGQGGDVGGAREALEQIASGPFGTTLLALVTAGLAGYVIWRLVQVFADPEADATDSDGKRWGARAFYLVSAGAYALLAWFGLSILTGNGGGSGSSSSSEQAQGLMTSTWGVWLLGLIGVAIVIRGAMQFWKAYTESFRDKIRRFDLGPARGEWVLRASRVGLTARGVVFGIVGVSVAYAALTRDPSSAQGTEGALEFLVGSPWLLGAVGVGLVCYAVYQWVKARYRIVGV